MKYLVKFKPLEPYTFGTDQTFNYPSGTKTGKESYFVLSGTVPAQTTILGALRYLALQQKDLLRTDFHYPDLTEGSTDSTKKDTPLQKVRETIGAESFRFNAETPQSFGVIQHVSPLFLLRGGHVLIRNPFHNRAKDTGYCPMKLTPESVLTSHGEIRLPADKEYDPKQGYATGYIDIVTKDIYRDLFRFDMLPGNQKTSEVDSRAYYRRQMVRLHSDCCFAVYVEADADAFPPDSVAYMGQKRAAFRVTAELSNAPTLETQVETAFADTSEAWHYALSPLWVPADTAYKTFCIVEELSQRNLTTDYGAERPIQKLKRSRVRYHLVQAGSVFHGECPPNTERENCRKIGYNSVVQLGGKLS